MTSSVLNSERATTTTTTTTLLIENEHLPAAVGARIYIHISSRGVCNGVIVEARGHLAELRTGTKVGKKTKNVNKETELRHIAAFHCSIPQHLTLQGFT